MQAIPKPERQRITFTEQGRRAQIVAAAIETIADLGYPQASFARIAKRAGLSSTGLISYHFASKRELDQEVVTTIHQRLSLHMHTAMKEASHPQGALVAYIEGLIGFMKSDPAALRAMLAVVMHGAIGYDAASERDATSGIADILQWGQTQGVFRPFDIRVMATTIQRSLDGIPLAQAVEPDLDLDAYASELVDLFTHATRHD